MAVGGPGPRARERGQRGGGGREVGDGRGGHPLVPDGLRHGGGGGAEVLVVLPRRAAQAGEDGRREVGLAGEQGEVGVVAGDRAGGLGQLVHVNVGHGGRVAGVQAPKVEEALGFRGGWRRRALAVLFAARDSEWAFLCGNSGLRATPNLPRNPRTIPSKKIQV